MADEVEAKMVKVKILPLHNIGGIGRAGDVVWMVEKEAAIYVEEGYVEIVDQPHTTRTPPELTLPESSEDHAVMKPQSKRTRK